jgi:hypothetical protein
MFYWVSILPARVQNPERENSADFKVREADGEIQLKQLFPFDVISSS